jgi:hypothetical protein
MKNNLKLSAINVWRIAQGLEPLKSSGKTAKAKANGSHAAQMGNAAARAQFCRDLKANRQNCKKR